MHRAYDSHRDEALHALANHFAHLLDDLKGATKWATDGITHARLAAWDRGYDVGFNAGKAAGVNLAGAKSTARDREVKEQRGV
jgi:hypothetical protein